MVLLYTGKIFSLRKKMRGKIFPKCLIKVLDSVGFGL